MVDELVTNVDVSRHLLVVKFSKSIIPGSLKPEDENDPDPPVQFHLIDTDDYDPAPAVPQDLTDHLRTINLEDDYDSFRNELTLYFETLPPYVGDYRLDFVDLVSVSGRIEATDQSLIAYTWDNTGYTPDPEPEDPPPTIVDKSIPKDLPYSDRTGGDPTDEASLGNPVLLNVDHDTNLITIDMGNPDYMLDASDFILEKKKVSIDFEKWQSVSVTSVTDDGSGVIEIQATDDFETQHKYRVRIDKEANNGTAAELYFLTDITPVIGDPEHVAMPLPPETTQVEVIEAMYRASVWVLKALKMSVSDDLPFVAYEYVAAAAQCNLSKKYGLQVTVAPNQTVRLGDLSVTSGNRAKASNLSRGTASDVCELAFALRQEVIRSSTSSNKAFHKGGKVMDRLPNRAPKSIRAKSSRRSIERF